MVDQDLHDDTLDRMEKSVDSMKKDFLGIRTGRASPAILDPIRVPAYGQEMQIKRLASVSIPEPRMMVIQPWDKSILSEIEKAIQKSDLGIHPNNDGKLLRLIFPPLTEERRRELVKVVHRKTEDGRVALRNVRRDALEMLRELEKEKEISQDEQKRAQERLQDITDKFIAEAGKAAEAKEAELLEI